MRRPFPTWMKKKLAFNEEYIKTRNILKNLHLNTVCQSAGCPNIGECFARGTATFMILGNVCTRNCRFCAVPKGRPEPLDEEEPKRVAEAVLKMKLKHVVVTSVTRDDLPDGGALHFAKTIEEIRKVRPDATIEVLTPDFKGDHDAIKIVVDAFPNIYNHNVETIPELYKTVRPQANYKRSLELLEYVKSLDDRIYTKSGLMVGLGESVDQVVSVMKDLRSIDCDIITIGQYLQPTKHHLEIVEFITPEIFKKYEEIGYELGFKYVASGPFVRSSFHAEDFFQKLKAQEKEAIA